MHYISRMNTNKKKYNGYAWNKKTRRTRATTTGYYMFKGVQA